MAEAPVFPCTSCGVPLAIDPTAAAASCVYCNATTAIPDAIREAARAYNREVREHGVRLTSAERFVQGDVVDRAFKAFFVVMGVLCVAFAAFEVASGAGGLDPDLAGYASWGFLAGVGLVILGFFVSMPFVVRRLEADENAVVLPVWSGSVSASCAHCGAPVTFGVGATDAFCRHCHKRVQVDAPHQRALAALAEQQTDLARARAGRSMHRDDAGPWAILFGALEIFFFAVRWLSPGIVVFYFGALMFSPTVANVVDLIQLSISVGLMILGALLMAGALALARWLQRRTPGERLHAALLEARKATRGRVRSGPLPVIHWLDAHWAGEAPSPVTTSENSAEGKSIARWSLHFAFGGRPALAVAAVSPHVDRMDFFLAAYCPSSEWGAALAKTERRIRAEAELRSAGFELLRSRAGVHMSRARSDPALLTAAGMQWLFERAGVFAAS